ncbi:MAG: DUF481 domain-containing protein [Verrucomicrobiota bacterium]|nr:DUF481 domain-containing protein [Verrucomicrobiota bacterium]
MKSVRFCLLYLVLITPGLLLAEKLVFKNGDSLTGSYLRTEEGYLFFKADILGEIKVNSADAEVVKDNEAPSMPPSPVATIVPPPSASESQSAEQASNARPAVEDTTESPADGAAAPAGSNPAAEPLPWWLENRVIRFLRAFHLLENWKSRLSAGYVWQSAEASRKDFTLRFTTERKMADTSELLAEARWDYGWQSAENQPAVINRDTYSGNFRYRHNWADRVFVQLNTRYQRDAVKQLDHDLDQNLGMGWKFIKTARIEASFTPAITAKYLSVEQQTTGWKFMTTAFQDFRYKITDKVSFIEEARYSIEPQNSMNWTLDISTKLEAKITNRLGVMFLWEYNYNSIVGKTIDKGQQRATSGMFYEF